MRSIAALVMRPRMLAGWSRGGLFVVYSELAAPSLFDARFAHSPASSVMVF